ncbi:YpmS family protein [Bacillus kexueae]|uniref:YpmS family protein n=1 Tax=Aeribacillus kexueae TaxID=2078952 RepID=UPI001FAED207|nr:YpmS family protein [Bacillus kexueae]
MNRWKISFLTLLTINIVVAFFVLVLAFLPVQKPVNEKVEYEKEEYASFLVHSDKETMSRLVNQFLAKQANNEPLSYYIEIEEDVKLYGTLQAFGRDLHVTISFIPRVTSEGDVVLSVHEMSVGKLALPISYVLNYIQKHYVLPNEVSIDADKAQVYVNLTDITLQNNYKIKAGKINLEKDEISAELLIPYENQTDPSN